MLIFPLKCLFFFRSTHGPISALYAIGVLLRFGTHPWIAGAHRRRAYGNIAPWGNLFLAWVIFAVCNRGNIMDDQKAKILSLHTLLFFALQ